MRSPAAEAYCRLTVLAPRARVDVALPADVPVAELVPMVLELVGEPVFGLRPEPWRLSGVAGGPLPPGSTLAQLGVLDGEIIRITVDAPAPAPPVFDDPVDALAATAGPGGAGGGRFGAAAVLAAVVAAAALLADLAGAGGTATLFATVAGATAAVAAITWGGLLARRAARAVQAGDVAEPGWTAAGTAALAAVPLAAAGGWAALPWLPTPGRVLLLAAAAGTAAAVAQIVLRVVAPALVAVVVAAVPVVLGAVVVLRFDVALGAVGAGLTTLVLVAGPLLPRVALRLAGLPRPVVPADGGELVDADSAPDLLPPDELAERADLARGYLAGLVGGSGAVAAGAVLPAAAVGGWAGPVLAAVTVAVLGLRARSFADATPVRALLASATVAGIGLAGVLALAGGPGLRFPVAAGLLAAAAAATTALGRTRPAGSPVSRRAVDILEGLLVIAAVPIALVVAGVFDLVGGW